MTFKNSRKNPDHTGTITLNHYKTLDLRRPLTDEPIGHYTGNQRRTDAESSAAWLDDGTETRAGVMSRLIEHRNNQEDPAA